MVMTTTKTHDIVNVRYVHPLFFFIGIVTVIVVICNEGAMVVAMATTFFLSDSVPKRNLTFTPKQDDIHINDDYLYKNNYVFCCCSQQLRRLALKFLIVFLFLCQVCVYVLKQYPLESSQCAR